MVAKGSSSGNADFSSSRVNPEYGSLFHELTKEYAPSFICKRKGDYFIGTFTGEMNLVPSEYGEVLVLEFEFGEGTGTRTDGEEFTPEPGDKVTYWFMGQLQHDAIVKYRPSAGEIVGIYNHGKRENRNKTFTYNDVRVLMPNRTAATKARKVGWDDVKPIGEDDTELAGDKDN